MSAWYLLLCAHDHFVSDRRWPLSVRNDGTKLLIILMNQLRYSNGR